MKELQYSLFPQLKTELCDTTIGNGANDNSCRSLCNATRIPTHAALRLQWNCCVSGAGRWTKMAIKDVYLYKYY